MSSAVPSRMSPGYIVRIVQAEHRAAFGEAFERLRRELVDHTGVAHDLRPVVHADRPRTQDRQGVLRVELDESHALVDLPHAERAGAGRTGVAGPVGAGEAFEQVAL